MKNCSSGYCKPELHAWLLSLCNESRSVIVTSVIQLLDFAAHMPCAPLSVNPFWVRFRGAVQLRRTAGVMALLVYCCDQRIPTWLCNITQSQLNRVTPPARDFCRRSRRSTELLTNVCLFAGFVHYLTLNHVNDYLFGLFKRYPTVIN